ncbi:hypothetical protein [Arthrobacter sp. Soil736]|uniref:hypothetical protein n=1 Tax=Arthrobacter sp. Soil736 TaxID=1736395 RepID=UPI0012F78C70|nr:hypothetical protein [Arthrobacter sp. Soil736]
MAYADGNVVRKRPEPFPALLVLWGATILVGKTRAGKLVLTRRRWKYFTLIGVVVGIIVVTVVVTAISPDRSGGNPALGLFPAIVGLFVAQLYETEGSAQFKASDLSDRDVRVWRKIALVPAFVGIVLACIAGIAGATGNIGALALLLPIGILFLVFAAAIWMMLRIRNRQLRAKP